MAAVDFEVPALEVVYSRIADWKISIVDTSADNGSSARYVLGASPRRLTDLDLETCGMVMTSNSDVVSVGVGAACLGHPLRAVQWLPRALGLAGGPLAKRDAVLCGGLGGMYGAAAAPPRE